MTFIRYIITASVILGLVLGAFLTYAMWSALQNRYVQPCYIEQTCRNEFGHKVECDDEVQ